MSEHVPIFLKMLYNGYINLKSLEKKIEDFVAEDE